MNAKPLPCPFCGSQPHFSWNDVKSVQPELPRGFWSLYCNRQVTKCPATVMAFGDTKAQAVENWNTRASDFVRELALQLLVCTETLLQYVPRWARNTTLNVNYIKARISAANKILCRPASCEVKPRGKPVSKKRRAL